MHVTPPFFFQHIKLSRSQYDVISRLAHDAKFSALPKKWLLKHPFPKWKVLTRGTGRSFHWGLCWEWTGPLKFGLISVGYEGVEELYSVILKAVEQLGSSWHFSRHRGKLLAESSKKVHPYTFLRFTHTGEELFQVTCSRSLRQHGDTPKGLMEVAKGVHQRNALTLVTPLEVAFPQRLWKLRAKAKRMSRTTAPDSSSSVRVISSPQENNWSETHNLQKVLHTAMDERMGEQTSGEEETLDRLEGLYSVVGPLAFLCPSLPPSLTPSLYPSMPPLSLSSLPSTFLSSLPLPAYYVSNSSLTSAHLRASWRS